MAIAVLPWNLLDCSRRACITASEPAHTCKGANIKIICKTSGDASSRGVSGIPTSPHTYFPRSGFDEWVVWLPCRHTSWCYIWMCGSADSDGSCLCLQLWHAIRRYVHLVFSLATRVTMLLGQYTPPSGCSFNRVTFNLTVTSRGRQFDRLAIAYLGDTEIWRTSTAEPTANGIE